MTARPSIPPTTAPHGVSPRAAVGLGGTIAERLLLAGLLAIVFVMSTAILISAATA